MSKIKATEKQLKHIYDVLEKEEIGYLQQTMNEWFPELFQPKLEVGKWYRFKRSGSLTYYQGENIESYGFHCTSNKYVKSHSWHIPTAETELKPATESEVFEALRNEAVKRGLTIGSTIKWPSEFARPFKVEFYRLRGGQLYVNDINICFNTDGKWAEIVEQPEEQSINLHEVIKAFQKANPNTTIIIDPQ